jgi:hypothetical protein
MPKWLEFDQCPHCTWNIATGEGDRGCSYGDCPYMPEELDVFCENCRFNFVTMEGNPSCEDPMACEYAPVPLSHVENYRAWAAARGISMPEVRG